MGVDEARASSPGYDYVLVAGPGRSGSTFLYRLLNAHPAFAAPEIKEGYYYRSVRRFDRARRKLRQSNTILLDVANTAWADPRLAVVAALHRRGWRILVVVLLRQHRERAVSVMAYWQSRMPFVASARWLERVCAARQPHRTGARAHSCARRGCARSPLRHPGRQPARGA